MRTGPSAPVDSAWWRLTSWPLARASAYCPWQAATKPSPVVRSKARSPGSLGRGGGVEPTVCLMWEGLKLVPSLSNRMGFKGLKERGGKYQEQVMEDGKQRYLRSFATPEEAALCLYARQSGKCATKDSP